MATLMVVLGVVVSASVAFVYGALQLLVLRRRRRAFARRYARFDVDDGTGDVAAAGPVVGGEEEHA